MKELSEIKGIKTGPFISDSSAGCTANVALLHNFKDLYIANAGDSRSILCNNGKAEELSHDHKPDNPEEKQRIE